MKILEQRSRKLQLALPIAVPPRPAPKPVDQQISLTYFARIRQIVEAAHEIQPYEHKFGKAL